MSGTNVINRKRMIPDLIKDLELSFYDLRADVLVRALL